MKKLPGSVLFFSRNNMVIGQLRNLILTGVQIGYGSVQ